MPTKCFKTLAAVQDIFDSEPLLEGWTHELHQAGYAEITAHRHIRAAKHFMDWINQQGIEAAGLNESSVMKFGYHLRRCRCPHYRRTQLAGSKTNSARLFLIYLRTVGVVPDTVPEPGPLTRFHEWMRQQRGTSDATLAKYNLPIRELLKHFGNDPRRFDAQKLRQFVLERSQQCGWAAAKKCTTAVRMFLRFLIAAGQCAADLDASIPTVPHWRLSSLPKYLESEDIERIIASCDRATPVGRRDRAILLLLARLALRAGDIVRLDLNDIDWEYAWIHVSGKGRRQTRLPLTQEVGDAIADYLQDGRPAIRTFTLFIRSFAPFRPLGPQCTVSTIVARAMRRAGVACPSRGAAHLLRHSMASAMLRQGTSLQEIADILRHRSIQTTEIYAKVDVPTLGAIAQPWPEVEIC